MLHYFSNPQLKKNIQNCYQQLKRIVNLISYYLLLIMALSFSHAKAGDGKNQLESKAQYHYMMFCQGCHGPNGEGAANRVPQLQGFIGILAQTTEGRSYLARVPGVLAPKLSDQDTAALLNWIIKAFSSHNSSNSSFLSKVATSEFTETEIKMIGRQPILDTNLMRLAIIRNAMPYISAHIRTMKGFQEWSQTHY